MIITKCTNKISFEEIRAFHVQHPLCGKSKNELLESSQDFLGYLIRLLRKEPLSVPQVSLKSWDDFLTSLQPHFILPLLYRLIVCSQEKIYPSPEVLEHLRKAYLASSARYIQIERRLADISAVFRENDIPLLVLRGLSFATTLYSNPATRPCSDIDLLILPQHVALARNLLSNLGYQCKAERFGIFDEFHCEETFICCGMADQNPSIDLHWGMHHFFEIRKAINLDEIFSRAIQVRTKTLTFKTLDPLDSLLAAAMHLFLSHNQGLRLIWIYDIAILAQCLGTEDEWRCLIQRSAAWRLGPILDQAMKAALLWLGFSIPQIYIDYKAKSFGEKENQIFLPSILAHDNLLSKFKLYWPYKARLGIKLRFLLHLSFPPISIMHQIYPLMPRWLLFLGYLRRWARWFVKLMQTLAPGIFGRQRD